MKERVTALVGNRARVMWVSTFHSACVRILRREAKHVGLTSSFSIYDAADSQRLMTLVCRELDLDPKRYNPRSFSVQVSNLKNELVDHETFAGRAETHIEQTLAEAYTLYQRRLREANALDFDDLIMTTVNVLQVFPDVAEHYRRRFRHVLVDEYQDTNHAQYVLVRELAGAAGRRPGVRPRTEPVPPAELCVVGDADQSIYAFRGATIRNILEFEEDYPDARTILLEQNYRSTQTILSAANAVIARNAGRKPKNLWSDAGKGTEVVGYVADNEHDEAAFVAGEVDRLTDEEGVQPRARRGVLPDQRAVPGVRGGVHPGRPALQGGRRRAVLRAPRGARRAGLPAAAGQPRGHGVAAPDPQRAQAGHRRPGRGLPGGAGAARAASPSPRPLRRCEDAYGLATRSLASGAGLPPADGRPADAGRGGHRPGDRAGGGARADRLRAELAGSADPQDETRLENLQELVAVAREFEEAAAADGAGRVADRLPRAGRAGRRRRPDPGRARGGRGGRCAAASSP